MERALLITVKLKSDRSNWSLDDFAQELEELTFTAGLDVVDNITAICEKTTPNLFIGKGKAQEIAVICQEEGIDTVVFSCDLSGTQQRNLEEIINRKTIDRTQLILDIFARHAKSPEGKTQVELAQLEYLLPRLIGKGIILSRLGGGIGTRGPGEQKLEVDRRRIRSRIDKLKHDLKNMSMHRNVVQKKRKENETPLVAIVGYTNAGKTTLLNRLTGSSQIVADSLFTTLDTVYKNITLSDGEKIMISDTVGFLNKLPHHLIEAFKSTLEEAAGADLLVHVLDVSHPRVHERNKAVLDVLREINADAKPLITALNKIDQLDDKTWLAQLAADFPNSLPISALSGENITELLNRIALVFQDRMVEKTLLISNYRMDLVDFLYRQAKVESIEYAEKVIKVRVNIPKVLFSKLLQDRDISDIS